MARQPELQKGISPTAWLLVGALLVVGCGVPQDEVRSIAREVAKKVPARVLDQGEVSRDLLFIMFELGQLAGTLLIVLYIVRVWRGSVYDRKGNPPTPPGT